MTVIFPSILLVASISLVPLAGALAQGSNANNPNNAAGATGSQVANPTYPPGQGQEHDPALATGTLSKGTPGVPPDKNPNVSGATGHTVVPGTNSTVAADREKTVHKKTGP